MLWKFIKRHWLRILSFYFMGIGVSWAFIEPYLGWTGTGKVDAPFWIFLVLALFVGALFFWFSGCFIQGYLKHRIVIQGNTPGMSVIVRFGDLFKQEGWKAIAVNDFFDGTVDDVIIHSSSLHGRVITDYWEKDGTAWKNEIKPTLNNNPLETVRERAEGNRRRYPIGTTTYISKHIGQHPEQKFIFVALGETNYETHEVSASAESLICAIRGLIKTARSVCGNEPLFIPLMGSALARVPGKQIVLIDLILAAVFEEAGEKNITAPITIILDPKNPEDINLESIAVGWK